MSRHVSVLFVQVWDDHNWHGMDLPLDFLLGDRPLAEKLLGLLKDQPVFLFDWCFTGTVPQIIYAHNLLHRYLSFVVG